ncbi:MAG: hypothetical protein ACM3OO_07240 [Planctomycetaceae bacterium]
MQPTVQGRVFERCATRAAWAVGGGAVALGVVAVLAAPSGVLTVLGFVPLAAFVVVMTRYRRAVAENRVRTQALMPSLQRHLSGSRAVWVLGGVTTQPVVALAGTELVLVRDGRTRVRVAVQDRDGRTEQVVVATDGGDGVAVETFRWGHVQDRRRVPDGFYTVT